MTKKQLRDHRDLKKEEYQVAELLKKCEARIYAPSTPKLDGMPHAAPNDTSAIERDVEEHIKLQKLYQEKLKAVARSALAVEQAIDALPTKERIVCRYYYIEALTWEQVCVKINYSWSQVHRIHANALKLLSE